MTFFSFQTLCDKISLHKIHMPRQTLKVEARIYIAYTNKINYNVVVDGCFIFFNI